MGSGFTIKCAKCTLGSWRGVLALIFHPKNLASGNCERACKPDSHLPESRIIADYTDYAFSDFKSIRQGGVTQGAVISYERRYCSNQHKTN